MCFSAEASFTAAALLGVIGYATLQETTKKEETLLASLPLFFALQQFSEGVLWLYLKGGNVLEGSGWIWASIYLFFAFTLWPIWVPASLLWPETDPKRKKIILGSLLLGALFVAITFYLAYGEELKVSLVDHSIQYSSYSVKETSQFVFLRSIYVLAILIPCFVSSIRGIWIFGLLLASTFIFSEWFYHQTFSSIWCFFAAACSASLFLILKYNKKNEYQS